MRYNSICLIYKFFTIFIIKLIKNPTKQRFVIAEKRLRVTWSRFKWNRFTGASIRTKRARCIM